MKSPLEKIYKIIDIYGSLATLVCVILIALILIIWKDVESVVVPYDINLNSKKYTVLYEEKFKNSGSIALKKVYYKKKK